MVTDVVNATYSRAIMNRLQREGATNSHHAVRPEHVGIVRSGTFQDMAECGAIRLTRDGRCFVDEPVARDFLHHRRVRWISIAAIVIMLTLLALRNWGLL